MDEKKSKKKVFIWAVIIISVAAASGIGALIYHKYYLERFKFKGLGDIYQTRNRQYKLFTERKITLDNKENPSKIEVRNLPSYKTRFTASLSDGSYLSVSLDFRFEKAEGIKEIRRKWERISFASSIALSAYSGNDLDKGGKDEVLVIIENQVRKRIFSEIKYIYVDSFDLRG